MTDDDYTDYVRSVWSRMFRVAYALTGDVTNAEDLLQRTLVKAYVHWRKVSRAESPDAYLRRMLVNDAATVYRHRQRRSEVLTSALPERGDSGFELDVAESDLLWQGVLALPARQRAVVVLRYYEDLTEQEIATTLGIAPGTVKSLASAALSKLRDRISPVDHLEDLT